MKPTPIKPTVYGYRDLMAATGLGRDTVKAAIRSGELPGYLVGRTYVVPEDAFQAFCEGRWTPVPRPVLAAPARPVAFLTRKRETA